MRIISNIVSAWIAILPCAAMGSAAFEASPAVLLSGQLAVRGEYIAKNGRGFGIDLSSNLGAGSSEYSSVQAAMLLAPKSFHGAFFGIGLAMTEQTTLESADRPAITYFRPEDGREHDQWQNEVSRLGFTQTLGYRLNLAKNFTSSVRVTLDERLHETASTKNEQMSAMSDAPQAKKLDPIEWRFGLHVGFLLP